VVSVEDIAAVPIFSSLDPDQLATIANWFDAEDVGKGVKLVGEGCHGYSFFVLMFGTEFRQLQDAYPEIADRITLAMRKRVGIAPSRSGS
jgi:hypothetical protein